MSSDDTPLNRESVYCGCGAAVPYDAADRGSTVYCPSCAAAVPIPDAAPHPPESSASVSRSASTGDGGARGVFSDTSALADVEVDRIVCLCGQPIPVTLADFDGSVYCPSCSAEVPVAKRLTRVRPREEPHAPPPVVAAVLKPNRPRFSPGTIALLALLAVASGFAVLNSWNDRAEIALALEKTHFRQATQASDAQTPFRLEAVTADAIEELKSHPHPFQALTLALTWRRELLAADPHRRDVRHGLLEQAIEHVLGERVAIMHVMIDEAIDATDVGASDERLRSWRDILITAGMPEDAEIIAHLDEARIQIEETLYPITLEQIEQLLEAQPEDALVRALSLDESLRRRHVPRGDARRERLADVLMELRSRLQPPDAVSDSASDEIRRLLGQLTQQLEDGLLERARQSADAARRLIDEHMGRLAMYAPRLQFLEQRIAHSEEAGRYADALLTMLNESRQLARTGQTTKAIQLDAQVRFRARRSPATAATAERLRQSTRAVAADIRRSRGIRAAMDARALDEQGDVARRNHEVRRALRLLAEFSAEDEVRNALEVLGPWKDDALAGSGSPALTSASSERARTILVRDQLEQALEMYARGQSADFESAALDLHQQLQSPESPLHSHDDALGECLLDVLETDVRAELAASGDLLRPGVLDQFQSRFHNLSDWNSLDGWTRIDSLINP